ncbi:Bacterial Ig-like domain (group 2) [uncultured Roseburia sp.]|uniref:Ig-like domain-containing protein n=1 Tax=Brotonthovivens ammoniilytica TaxID=2981725 RepID=A0ABT2TMR1_9FIRM|nr:Ig-like domain-containing protein [Brotonthovivens ammoniilytica]MCU6763507.1 Ig-like domain-containing protein [Brotonthovivens ammoniilytica]SCJ21798.1 Bacterial Ig-like domain (group 2) [uncultured Roseburia sp.]
MKKRLLALFLAGTLVFSMSASVLAQESEPERLRNAEKSETDQQFAAGQQTAADKQTAADEQADVSRPAENEQITADGLSEGNESSEGNKISEKTQKTQVILDSYEETISVYSEGLQLYAEVWPETMDQKVTWTSSDEEIADVDEDGFVCPYEPGTVIITATAADGASASCKVTVTEEEGLNTDEALEAVILWTFLNAVENWLPEEFQQAIAELEPEMNALDHFLETSNWGKEDQEELDTLTRPLLEKIYDIFERMDAQQVVVEIPIRISFKDIDTDQKIADDKTAVLDVLKVMEDLDLEAVEALMDPINIKGYELYEDEGGILELQEDGKTLGITYYYKKVKENSVVSSSESAVKKEQPKTMEIKNSTLTAVPKTGDTNMPVVILIICAGTLAAAVFAGRTLIHKR